MNYLDKEPNIDQIFKIFKIVKNGEYSQEIENELLEILDKLTIEDIDYLKEAMDEEYRNSEEMSIQYLAETILALTAIKLDLQRRKENLEIGFIKGLINAYSDDSVKNSYFAGIEGGRAFDVQTTPSNIYTFVSSLREIMDNDADNDAVTVNKVLNNSFIESLNGSNRNSGDPSTAMKWKNLVQDINNVTQDSNVKSFVKSLIFLIKIAGQVYSRIQSILGVYNNMHMVRPDGEKSFFLNKIAGENNIYFCLGYLNLLNSYIKKFAQKIYSDEDLEDAISLWKTILYANMDSRSFKGQLSQTRTATFQSIINGDFGTAKEYIKTIAKTDPGSIHPRFLKALGINEGEVIAGILGSVPRGTTEIIGHLKKSKAYREKMNAEVEEALFRVEKYYLGSGLYFTPLYPTQKPYILVPCNIINKDQPTVGVRVRIYEVTTDEHRNTKAVFKKEEIINPTVLVEQINEGRDQGSFRKFIKIDINAFTTQVEIAMGNLEA